MLRVEERTYSDLQELIQHYPHILKLPLASSLSKEACVLHPVRASLDDSSPCPP